MDPTGEEARNIHDSILIDECLSDKLVAIAKARGHQATHVKYYGKSGTEDWDLISFITQHNFIFVTNNRRDFLKLYERQPIHNGLIIIVPSIDRTGQIRLFELVLDEIERQDHLINKVIQIYEDGRITIEELCSDGVGCDPVTVRLGTGS
jgi:predicted nuclease of predicted toxin-antitoxin system